MSGRLGLACVATLVGCAGADAAPPDERPYTEVSRAGVTMRLPDRWRSLPPNDGNVIDPLTRVAIASGPLRATLPGCATQITNYAPRPDGAVLVVVEWKPSEDAHPPPRPRRLGEALSLRPGAIECFAAEGGSVHFVEHDRVFGMYVMVGARADERLVEEVRAAADTLRVERGG
jgi:hypothetical protein